MQEAARLRPLPLRSQMVSAGEQRIWRAFLFCTVKNVTRVLEEYLVLSVIVHGTPKKRLLAVVTISKIKGFQWPFFIEVL